MLVKQSSKRYNVKLCESCTENHKGIRVLVKLPITTWVFCRGKYSDPLDQRSHELLQLWIKNNHLPFILYDFGTSNPDLLSDPQFILSTTGASTHISLIQVTGKNHLWCLILTHTRYLQLCQCYKSLGYNTLRHCEVSSTSTNCYLTCSNYHNLDSTEMTWTMTPTPSLYFNFMNFCALHITSCKAMWWALTSMADRSTVIP